MLEVLILSLALSMDAFVVSIGLGVKNKKNIKLLALKAGILFGVFQAIMPLIGYLGGMGLKKYIAEYDSIVAFILLLIIGVNMLHSSLQSNSVNNTKALSNKILLTLAIATSIDAMAAGFILNLFALNIFFSLTIIGLTTFIFSALGVYLGGKSNKKHGDKAEMLGGVILILIGFKILIF